MRIKIFLFGNLFRYIQFSINVNTNLIEKEISLLTLK